VLKTLIQYVGHWATVRPDSIAFVDPYRQVSYAELCTEIGLLQDSLLEMGINKGDTIAISANKSVDMVVFYLALFGLGVSVVPLPEKKDNVSKSKKIIDLTNTKYVLTNNAILERGEWNLFSADSFMNNNTVPIILKLENILKSNIDVRNYDEDEPVYFNLTSGSTGNIKAARIGNKEIIYNGLQVNQRFPIGDEDCYCCLFSTEMHPHELFVRPVISGAKCLLLPNFYIRYFNRYLLEEKVTHLLTTPNILQKLLIIVREKSAWQSMKHALSGGENVPYVLRKQFFETTSKKLIVAWGSTETSGIVITLPEEYSLDQRNILGVPIPGYDIKIDQETNELLIRGESCIENYWNYTGPSPLDEAGFYHTSDAVSVDDEGVLFYEGRLNSIIKVGGKKISLINIETQLLQVEGLSEVAVVYAQDEMKTYVFICINGNYNIEKVLKQVKEILKKKLSSQGFRLVLLPQLPKLTNGKLDKQKLLVCLGRGVYE
jgi:long-chain acyl-CoA synthetase